MESKKSTKHRKPSQDGARQLTETIAWKLFRKTSDGLITSLFANKTKKFQAGI